MPRHDTSARRPVVGTVLQAAAMAVALSACAAEPGPVPRADVALKWTVVDGRASAAAVDATVVDPVDPEVVAAISRAAAETRLPADLLLTFG